MKYKSGKGPSIFVVCGDLSEGRIKNTVEIEKVCGI